jgi:succinyl-diaminopimelate desuccinylase
MSKTMSAQDLAAELIRCESVTPREDGALDVLEKALGTAGFKTHRLKFSDQNTPDIDNLYARYGTGAPHLCFAGHVDVVPPGDEAQWLHGPFSGHVEQGMLYGRGAVDMKGGVACFTAAAIDFVAVQGDNFKGSISFLITGDEEGPAINGTRKMLEWMAQNNEVPDHCLLGEPTNPEQLGDMIKIGRRGSLNGTLKVFGTQGHAAYPHLAKNSFPSRLTAAAIIFSHPIWKSQALMSAMKL